MRMSLRVIIVGGLVIFLAVVAVVVFVPDLIWNPPRTIDAHTYTALTARGRKLFYSNGCNYCHTQYVRAQDTAMGPQSDGGNYVFDNPMILGSERTGPDLSYIGRKRSRAWEVAHLQDPRGLSPMSIMPSYAFLGEESLEAIAAYLFDLGDRVAQERMILPPEAYAGLSDPSPPPVVDAPGGGEPNGWPTWKAAGLQDGKETYVLYCLACHGCAGNGLGSYAGTMAVTPADLSREPYRSMPEDQWFWHVSEGVPGTLMPPWKASMSERDRWSVVRYVRQVFAHPVLRDPDEGDPTGEYANLTNPVKSSMSVVDDGKAIYTRECLVCHGAAGRGEGPYAGRILPPPPDFGSGEYGTLDDPSMSDAAYFQDISEGLPWSAMPSWKLHYSDDDIWKLVHYVRAFLTMTEAQPQLTGDALFEFPDVYQDAGMPDDVSYERGRDSFARRCARCHGLAGDGKGWDAGRLEPPPSDLRVLAFEKQTSKTDGEYLAQISFGLYNSAMPVWGELLPRSERWDLVKYLAASFGPNPKAPPGAWQEGKIGAAYATVGVESWTEQGGRLSAALGKPLYDTYCSTCHGASGAGDGPGTLMNASAKPSPFHTGMGFAYTLWKTREGVDGTMMYAFGQLLADDDIGNISAWVDSVAAPSPRGG
jgi:cytochrome c oxidase cbb3-type subunit 2